jgi:hypothetical protein
MDRNKIRAWSGRWSISAEPVLTPMGGGWLMTESPLTAFAVLLSWLGLSKNQDELDGRSAVLVREQSPEEVIVYTSDNLDFVIRNYGTVSLEEDLTAEDIFNLGGVVDDFLKEETEEVAGYGHPWDFP